MRLTNFSIYGTNLPATLTPLAALVNPDKIVPAPAVNTPIAISAVNVTEMY